MESLLNNILYQKIENVNILFENELYLYMEKYTLAIYAPFSINSTLNDLISSTILNIDESINIINIKFDNNSEIKINIESNGLENMVLTNVKTNKVIVW